MKSFSQSFRFLYGIRAKNCFRLEFFIFPLSCSSIPSFFNSKASEASSMASSDSSAFASLSTIDVSHPFFLHHAESPSTVLISQPLIGSENYLAWARSMERALSIKHKLGFIDGTTILTPSMSKEPLVAQAWTRCNNIVVTWILNCVSPRIATSVTYCNTALDVWNNLWERFSQGNGPRFFNCKKILLAFHRVIPLSVIISLSWQFFGMRSKILVPFLVAHVVNAHAMSMERLQVFNTRFQSCNC